MKKRIFLKSFLMIIGSECLGLLLSVLLLLYQPRAYVLWIIIDLLISILTLLPLKQIEKCYYRRYNGWWSMLYMACPTIGVPLFMYLLLKIFKSDVFSYLFYLNMYLYLTVLVLNLVYIVIKKLQKK